MNIAIKDGQFISLDESMANRHGLVAGATGTGKTITIKLMAEEFAKAGVPVFITDIKGDLSGFLEAGTLSPKLAERLEKIGAPSPEFESFTVNFWDVLKENGIPLRATISEMGPLLLSRLLNLNDTQTGVLYALFKIADDQGLLLLDFKDLSEMLKFLYENSKELSKDYGNMSKASIGAIQRSLLILEQQGATEFFQEPALDVRDFLQKDRQARGVINILDARKIYHNPDIYSAFLLLLLSNLYEELPEVGDQPLPKLVFFFEEAHLIFQNASKVLLEKIEQIVKLIRSKGVGVFFITQNPRDIPDNILAQMGNRVQHALRAYTPAEQRLVKAVADSFRNDAEMNVAEELLALKTGEALISTLDENGAPTPVVKAFILAPASNMDPASSQSVENAIKNSYFYNKYEKTFDSHSAYEVLKERAEQMAEEVKSSDKKEKEEGLLGSLLKPRSSRDTAMERMIKNTMGSFGSQLGREIFRGVLGGIKKDK
ncbi:MAG TPA: helicase HerA-like domain-containing protein [Clostridia bacterium]|nr:helicase HerA-like domain-containing protein [Clostridia bacterium]